MDTRVDVSHLGWHRPIVAAGRKQSFELIPTWQQGMVQPQDADYANLIRQGYRKHAVIHACISLLASAGAAVPWRLYRGDEPVERHGLLDLMERPNDWQSGTEFRHLLLTHLLATGNAYVEFMRGGGAVQQMGLLRPDRITIKPGPRREDDLYVYEVGDRKRFVPQPDIMHLPLPNPDNDFYGLSPIEPMTREANLDIDLTLFVKAWFDNAGVPFGLLSIQGRSASEEEQKEIKGKWRRAFNRTAGGVRKFFELLILNAEEAKYQELGKTPKDLEMEAVRLQAESRICMAYRVPPIMVGARVGLEFGTYSNYETAEKTFWRYGVAYYLALLQDRFNLELIPELRRSGDSDLRLDFDLSAVPALAEDNTEKLNAVSNLLKTGSFTGNQALNLVGLPPVDGGDVYVRQLTQVVERPLNGAGKVALLEGRVEAKAAARRLAPVIEAIRERAMSRMVPDLREFFDGQAQQVNELIEAFGELANTIIGETKIRGITEDDIFPSGQDEALMLRLNGHYLAIDRAVWESMTEALGLTVDYDEAGPVAQRILQRGATRVVEINGVTRAAIRDVLALAEERGYSLYQVVNGVADDSFPGLRAIVEETYQNRAEAVARTEAGFATNDAALGRYAEAGVREVELIDGGGATGCDVCDERNGTRVPVSEQPDLAHPNCTLVVVPVVE